jgi:hypothetical protein
LVYKNSKPDFVISTHRPLMWVPQRQHTSVSIILQLLHNLPLSVRCQSLPSVKLLMLSACHGYFKSSSGLSKYVLKLLALLLFIIL